MKVYEYALYFVVCLVANLVSNVWIVPKVKTWWYTKKWGKEYHDYFDT